MMQVLEMKQILSCVRMCVKIPSHVGPTIIKKKKDCQHSEVCFL
jgi:hypothetical protein